MIDKKIVEETQSVNPVRRCPRCHSLNLIFDTTNNQFMCKQCGFVQKLPIFRRLFEHFKK
jgi:ribosomal protein S27E